jgi:uncharacterized protein (DUF1330 family)
VKAYAIVVEDIKDQEMFASYRTKVMATLETFGGRFLVRGGKATTLEGAWPRARTVVIEFPSRERAEAWYRSPEYQAILPLRAKAGEADFIIIDGVEP